MTGSRADALVLERLVRDRRTVKSYRPDPVPRDVVADLLELARWAPNHRMTEPWRFRVLGPAAVAALKAASGEGAAKLDRAPTLVVASVVPSPLPLHAQEDLHSGAIAAYLVLLGAHARGYAGYWRTPAVLRTPEGRAACGIGGGEVVLGLLHLGEADAAAPPEVPVRRAPEDYVEWLD